VTFTVFDVPDSDGFVHGAASEEIGGGVEAHAEDVVGVTLEDFHTFRL
jgi:hypothetical protein